MKCSMGRGQLGIGCCDGFVVLEEVHGNGRRVTEEPAQELMSCVSIHALPTHLVGASLEALGPHKEMTFDCQAITRSVLALFCCRKQCAGLLAPPLVKSCAPSTFDLLMEVNVHTKRRSSTSSDFQCAS